MILSSIANSSIDMDRLQHIDNKYKLSDKDIVYLKEHLPQDIFESYMLEKATAINRLSYSNINNSVHTDDLDIIYTHDNDVEVGEHHSDTHERVDSRPHGHRKILLHQYDEHIRTLLSLRTTQMSTPSTSRPATRLCSASPSRSGGTTASSCLSA